MEYKGGTFRKKSVPRAPSGNDAIPIAKKRHGRILSGRASKRMGVFSPSKASSASASASASGVGDHGEASTADGGGKTLVDGGEDSMLSSPENRQPPRQQRNEDTIALDDTDDDNGESE